MTSPRLALREATPADAASIADVHEASISVLGSDGYDDEQVRAWRSNVHPERYPLEESGFRIVVAERAGGSGGEDERDGERGDGSGTEDDDSAVVGFGLLDLEPSDLDDPSSGKVGAVYVRPEHVREGVGRAILDDLESAARDAGLETLVLEASKNAIEFYRRRGYEGAETVRLEMSDGVELEALRMRKRLA